LNPEVDRNLTDRVFNPKSIAVIGASRDEKKWGFMVAKHLIAGGYSGRIHFVNPRRIEILGRKAFASVLELNEPVELALVLVGPRAVPTVVADCAKVGVGAVVVFASGFGETVSPTKALEAEMVQVARNSGMRIFGPNCMGIFSSSSNMNATGMPLVPKGAIALVSQSGNMGLTLFHEAMKKQIGISKFISIGNQSDVEFSDCLSYLRTDDSTKAIVMFIEGIKDGRSFLREARDAVKSKPVVVMKVGRSGSGARSALTHTGSLAGSDVVHDGLFKQVGIVRVEKTGDLLDVARILATSPPPTGKRLGIITDGGGHGTIACDTAESLGFSVPMFSANTQARLQTILSQNSTSLACCNPVDVGDLPFEFPEVFSRCCEVCLDCSEVDILLIAGLFGGYGSGQVLLSEETRKREETAAHEIVGLVRKYRKPVVVHSIYADDQPKAIEILRQASIPVYDSVEKAVRCLAKLRAAAELRSKVLLGNTRTHPGRRADRIDKILTVLRYEGRTRLLETEVRELAELYCIPVCKAEVAVSLDDTVSVANTIGYPVAMKIISPDIVHKSDADCVKLNLKSDEEVKQAYLEILKNAKRWRDAADVRGVLLAPYLRSGVETVVGITHDNKFGSLIMFGLGGIFVELLGDVVFRSVPISREDANMMIDDLRNSRVLHGVRGQPKSDREAITSLLLSVSNLAEGCPEIDELEFNPILAFEKGVLALDARGTIRA
jgi:acetate---CoA ligase (ADP-forming)